MTEVERRPRVALTIGKATTARSLASRRSYVDALERAGAEVVVVEPGDELPADIDALCIAGGPDIAPGRYGESDPGHLAKEPDPPRDELELDAATRAFARDLPVLGICRGFQVLNVARGGKLVLHVDDHEPDDPGGVRAHREVIVRSGSKLAEACGSERLDVNSRHHQAVTEELLGRGLVPTAAVGGLVEAFEATDQRWVLGVQWHPERTAEVSPEARRIFDAFVAAAARTTASAR